MFTLVLITAGTLTGYGLVGLLSCRYEKFLKLFALLETLTISLMHF